jgi:DNA-directed RNA polymerase subunit RPC12/RpoP
MSNDYHEKDFDDEVYEDDYYEKHYDEEELEDSADHLEEEEIEEEEEEEKDPEVEKEVKVGDEAEEPDELEWDEDEKKITVSYACDECDYRWDDLVIRKKGEIEEELDIICPMCGSMNVTLI